MTTEEAIQELEERPFSFKRYAWRQFRKNRPAMVSLWTLAVLALIAILSPLISNDKPLYAKYNGQHLFPAFSTKNSYMIEKPDGTTEKIQLDIAKWKLLEYETVIWPPFTYAPGKTDAHNSYLNSDYKAPGANQQFMTKDRETIALPKRYWHWLGTGGNGEDLMAGLIHGTKISLMIGFVSMGIATLIGLILGALAGYFGDYNLTISRGGFWMTLLGLFLGFYYGFIVRGYALSDGLAAGGFPFIGQLLLSVLIFAAIAALFWLAAKPMRRVAWLGKQVNVPVDATTLRIIEILISIPQLILIIAMAAIAEEPSIINVMVIIGLTSWTGIARFTRAEFLRIRELEYIQAAQALGYSQRRIIFRHALPNSLAPALVAIAFGVASAILIESGLSFLGIGVPHDTVTWGSLLNLGREHFNAWWLVIFPGLCIFITVTAYNLIGEGLRDALDPRLKK